MLKQSLDSLIGNIKVSHEIIVVDAGSTDGTVDYVKNLKMIRLVCDGELIGQAKSLNRVVKTLNSKYVCWLSDDNIVRSGMLDLAVSILGQDPEIGMVSLKVKDILGPHQTQDYLGGIWPTGVLNCNQGILPVELFLKIGGFDEQLRDYGIDGDLTTRMLLEGKKVVYTKQVAIYHLRDHETNSWIDSTGRKLKMDNARRMYERKFVALQTIGIGGLYNKTERSNSLLLIIIRLCYSSARKMGVSIDGWLGLMEKDWINLFTARFISKMDFFYNIFKPYYLVQRIPRVILEEVSIKSLLRSRVVDADAD